MTPRELISSLSSKAKWILGFIALIAGVILVGAWPPLMLVLLGCVALALLYIVARRRSRYDPLDPRFGSCIPPITMPRAEDNSPSLTRPDVGVHRFEG
jgi:hypothetical protein